MKKHILQENYEKIFGSIEEGWWDNMGDAAKKAYIKKHGSAPGSAGDDEPKVPAPDSRSDTGKPRVYANPFDDNYGQEVDDEDDYDMGVVPGSREEWEDIEPGDPEMRSGDESAEELGDLMKQQQNHIEDMFEKGADREDIEAAEGNLEDLEREYDEKVEAGEDVGTSHSDKGTDPVTGLSARTGKELNQETLTIDGKQFRRISEGVEKESKPKYTFSEFYQRFKR